MAPSGQLGLPAETLRSQPLATGFTALKASEHGLTVTDAAARLKTYGSNTDVQARSSLVLGAIAHRFLEPLNLPLAAQGLRAVAVATKACEVLKRVAVRGATKPARGDARSAPPLAHSA